MEVNDSSKGTFRQETSIHRASDSATRPADSEPKLKGAEKTSNTIYSLNLLTFEFWINILINPRLVGIIVFRPAMPN